VPGCFEHGDELSGSGGMELISLAVGTLSHFGRDLQPSLLRFHSEFR
jgi:hypothetical protein